MPSSVARLDGGEQFVEAVLVDQFAHGRRVDHDFDRRHHAARDGRHEALANDGLHSWRPVAGGSGRARAAGKKSKNATNGGVRRGGVKRGQHEVARIGGGQRGHERLAVAHLADHDHVGVLPHDVVRAPARNSACPGRPRAVRSRIARRRRCTRWDLRA